MADTMPVFVIKAKDTFAVPAIIKYRDMCLQHGLAVQAAEVDKAIEEMYRWREAHHGEIRFPDHAHVPAGETTPAPRVSE